MTHPDTTDAAAGDLLVAAGISVELRPNPRSKPRCSCGSERPTIWQIVTRDARKLDCCIVDCVERLWVTERLFIS